MSEIPELLKCPFCLSHFIEVKSDANTFPECDAQFEIDDRLECVFANIKNLRLPAIGTICTSCDLMQAGSHQNCLNCGTAIYMAVQ